MASEIKVLLPKPIGFIKVTDGKDEYVIPITGKFWDFSKYHLPTHDCMVKYLVQNDIFSYSTLEFIPISKY